MLEQRGIAASSPPALLEGTTAPAATQPAAHLTSTTSGRLSQRKAGEGGGTRQLRRGA